MKSLHRYLSRGGAVRAQCECAAANYDRDRRADPTKIGGGISENSRAVRDSRPDAGCSEEPLVDARGLVEG